MPALAQPPRFHSILIEADMRSSWKVLEQIPEYEYCPCPVALSSRPPRCLRHSHQGELLSRPRTLATGGQHFLPLELCHHHLTRNNWRFRRRCWNEVAAQQLMTSPCLVMTTPSRVTTAVWVQCVSYLLIRDLVDPYTPLPLHFGSSLLDIGQRDNPVVGVDGSRPCNQSRHGTI